MFNICGYESVNSVRKTCLRSVEPMVLQKQTAKNTMPAFEQSRLRGPCAAMYEKV